MRVIAGKARGLKLKTIEGNSTRPTKDMVKEALFSILMPYVTDCVFLDLFAGSGAIGIEALSRGAQNAVFCDQNKECIKIINENIEKARFKDISTVYNLDYLKCLERIKNQKFDIIFIDPPYNIGLGLKAIQTISDFDLLMINGVLVFETDEIEEVPNEIGLYEKFNTKRYGRNVLNFFKRKGN